jgi:hypothetical protein
MGKDVFGPILDLEPLSTEHDGWDDSTTLGLRSKYQMVPKGEDRYLSAKGECIVYSDPKEYATVSSPTQHSSSTSNRIVLRPTDGMTVSAVKVHGVSDGRGQVIACDASGKTLDSVVFSVKKPQRKTYRLWVLKDIATNPTRTEAQMIALMRHVEKAYLAQTNTTLVRLGGFAALNFKRQLGNPIKSIDLLLVDVGIAIKLSNLPSADFDLVSTWKLDGAVGQTSMISKTSLIQDYKPEQELNEASTFAHELCHAFGRSGHTSDRDRMMSDGGVDSFHMAEEDIDQINSSGDWRGRWID